jgi:hypothetical protein
MISEFFKKCDIFGYMPHMKINKKQTFHTLYGGINSILIFITILYSIWHFGNEIIFKRLPYVITTTYNDEDPHRINLTDSNFGIALGLQNPDFSLYINETIYKLKLFQSIMRRTGDGDTSFERREISLISCDKKEFKLVPDYFKLMDLKNLYCINDTDLFLKGDFGREVWSWLDFSFFKCRNSTENEYKCRDEEEINRRLHGGYFGMFITDTTIEPSNYQNPAKSFGRNIFTTFSYKAFRQFSMYIRNIEVYTDSGWLMEDISITNYFSIDNLREFWDFRDTSEIFFNLEMRNSSNRLVFNRSYLKLQTLAANVGGIIKFLLLCGKILTYIFRNISYREFLTYIFYGCNNLVFTNSPIIINKVGFNNELIINNNNSDNKLKISSITKNLTDKERSISDKFMMSRITFFEIIRYYSRCSNQHINKKASIIKERYDTLEPYFDWIHLIKLQSDVEIMKSFVFTKEQLNVVSGRINIRHNQIEVI